MRFTHLIERDGSRAGTRSKAGASGTDGPLGIGAGPSPPPSARQGVVGCALAETVVDRYDDGEVRVVGGVGWVCGSFTATDGLGRAGALKTEELALVWELADPPALSVSPVSDSASSVGGGGAV